MGVEAPRSHPDLLGNEGYMHTRKHDLRGQLPDLLAGLTKVLDHVKVIVVGPGNGVDMEVIQECLPTATVEGMDNDPRVIELANQHHSFPVQLVDICSPGNHFKDAAAVVALRTSAQVARRLYELAREGAFKGHVLMSLLSEPRGDGEQVQAFRRLAQEDASVEVVPLVEGRISEFGIRIQPKDEK